MSVIKFVLPDIHPGVGRVATGDEPGELQAAVGHLHNRVAGMDVVVADVVEAAAVAAYPAGIHAEGIAALQRAGAVEVGAVGSDNVLRLVLVDGGQRVELLHVVGVADGHGHLCEVRLTYVGTLL